MSELPASDVCMRWTERRHSWRHRSEGGFDARRYEVADVDELTAKRFVVAHHYSASYPASRLRYGLWHGGELVGVAVLSVPVRAEVLTIPFPDLVPYAESLELGRFVLVDRVEANGESWFLARALALAARAGLRGIVSFSDPVPRRTDAGQLVMPGHVGTIYQASNAAYAGRGTARSVLVLPDGRILNERALSKARRLDRGHEYVEELLCRLGATPRQGADPRIWLPRALKDARVRRIRHPGNHRYLFSFGDGGRRTVVAGLPYPKRDLEAA